MPQPSELLPATQCKVWDRGRTKGGKNRKNEGDRSIKAGLVLPRNSLLDLSPLIFPSRPRVRDGPALFSHLQATSLRQLGLLNQFQESSTKTVLTATIQTGAGAP